jgi:hypothetical protein
VSRLRRFLHIERSRPAPPGAPASSGTDLDRFSPPPVPGIELVSTDAAERPFTRCMRCEMDHNVFATECAMCGASLDTEAQREFNERLWAARREEAAAERRAEAERAAARAAEQERTGVDPASRRALGEALAREVGDAERQRLAIEGFGGQLRFWGEDTIVWGVVVSLGRGIRALWRRLASR